MNLVLAFVLLQIKRVPKFNSLGLILSNTDNVYIYINIHFYIYIYMIFSFAENRAIKKGEGKLF